MSVLCLIGELLYFISTLFNSMEDGAVEATCTERERKPWLYVVHTFYGEIWANLHPVPSSSARKNLIIIDS